MDSSDALYGLLSEKEAALQEELARLTAPTPMGENLSFGKRVGDGTAMAISAMENASSAQALERQLLQVQAALARFEAGTYGLCASCGNPIPPARLEALPWATHCLVCA